MASPNGGAKVGALKKGKSRGRKNKGVEGEDGSRFRMKLRFLFSCLALRSKPKRLSG